MGEKMRMRNFGIAALVIIMIAGMANSADAVGVRLSVQDSNQVELPVFRVSARLNGVSPWGTAHNLSSPVIKNYNAGANIDIKGWSLLPIIETIALNETVVAGDSLTVTKNGVERTILGSSDPTQMKVTVVIDFLTVIFDVVDQTGTHLIGADGQVRLTGGASSNGFKGTPYTRTVGDGAIVNVQGRNNITGAEIGPIPTTINKGDSILVTATGFTVVGPAANGTTKVTAQVADMDVVFRVIDSSSLDLTGGEVSVTGAASTNGFQQAPQTVTVSSGDTLSVEAQLLGSALPNIVANDLVVVEGDSIILGVGAPQTINDPLRTGAVVVSVYDVLDVEVLTVDETGIPLPGNLSITGGATVSGSSPRSFQITGTSASLDISATYLNEIFAVSGVQVDVGDSIAVKRSSAGVTIEEFPGHYTGLSKVAMVMVGNMDVIYTTVDKDDLFLANGRVVINGGGTKPTPFTQLAVGQGATVDVEARDITIAVPMVVPPLVLFNGDSIVVDASAASIDTVRYPGAVASGARVTVILRSVSVTMTTVDFAGNFLVNGRVQVPGPTAATQTNGFKPTPFTVKRAEGDTIAVESLLSGSGVQGIVASGLQVSEGDSIILSDTAPVIHNAAVTSGARIRVVYNVMSVTVATTDTTGAALNGNVNVPGVGGSSGPSPRVLQVSSSGVTLASMTGVFESESYTPTNIAVALGDSIVIKQGLGGLEVNTIQAGIFGAKINMVMLGDVATQVSAFDGNGDPLATGQVQVNQGALTPSPLI